MFRSHAAPIPAQVQFQAQSLPAVVPPTTSEVSAFSLLAAPTPLPLTPEPFLRELRGEFEEEMEGGRE